MGNNDDWYPRYVGLRGHADRLQDEVLRLKSALRKVRAMTDDDTPGTRQRIRDHVDSALSADRGLAALGVSSQGKEDGDDQG